MFEWLTENWKDIALATTSLVTAASVIIRLTPAKTDDAILSKILSFLRIISLTPPEKAPAES